MQRKRQSEKHHCAISCGGDRKSRGKIFFLQLAYLTRVARHGSAYRHVVLLLSRLSVAADNTHIDGKQSEDAY
jgi:hypothetical protein